MECTVLPHKLVLQMSQFCSLIFSESFELRWLLPFIPLSNVIAIPFFVFIQNFSVPEDLSAYDGLELRLKGDGRRYKLIVRTSTDWDTIGYTAGFDTVKGQWQSVSNTI